MTSKLAVTLADVDAAAERIGGAVIRTPVIRLHRLGLWAKCESLQAIGAFKIRGATNAVRSLDPDAVVTASSGNHGQAVAAAAAAAHIPCTVVMSEIASPLKRARTVALGATVIDVAGGMVERIRTAEQLAERDGATWIPSFDHPLVIAGQGTVGREIIEQVPDATAIVAPVGGGALLSGIAVATRHINGPGLIGVEPVESDDFRRSLEAGERVTVPTPHTICDGANGTTPGALTFPIIQALVDDVLTVSDDVVVEAMRHLAAEALYVEPTAALSVAGALELGLRDAVCVISGRNISTADYARLVS